MQTCAQIVKVNEELKSNHISLFIFTKRAKTMKMYH